jgi:uridylate kinase
MAKKLKYKRIMIKISGEVLEGDLGQGIDFRVLDELCREVAAVKKLGAEIAIVIGGGNFWRYRDFKTSGLDHVHSDYMGMLATVMNSIAIQHSLKKAGVDSRPLSSIPMQQVVGTYLRDKALDYLEKGKVVICGGGTGNPFFTTDSAAALRALEMGCDVLLKATKVDYVYDKDPEKFKDAKSYRKISYDEVFRQELEVMDLSAIDLCAKAKMPVIVFNLKKKGNIARVVKGENIGTLIS